MIVYVTTACSPLHIVPAGRGMIAHTELAGLAGNLGFVLCDVLLFDLLTCRLLTCDVLACDVLTCDELVLRRQFRREIRFAQCGDAPCQLAVRAAHCHTAKKQLHNGHFHRLRHLPSICQLQRTAVQHQVRLFNGCFP